MLQSACWKQVASVVDGKTYFWKFIHLFHSLWLGDWLELGLLVWNKDWKILEEKSTFAKCSQEIKSQYIVYKYNSIILFWTSIQKCYHSNVFHI